MNFAFLLVAFVSSTLAKQDVWDGDKYDFTSFIGIKTAEKSPYNDQKVKVSKENKLDVSIEILPHIRFKNVYLAQFNVTNHLPGQKGYVFYLKFGEQKGEVHIFSQGYKKEQYFYTFPTPTCQLYHCEAGFRMVHKNDVSKRILSDEIKDFIGAYYIKLVSSNYVFTLAGFKINGNSYPLIICPHERWVGLYSGMTFIPYEVEGIIYDAFFRRQIMLPAYQRSETSRNFKCGEIKYVDDTYLSVEYKITFVGDKYLNVDPFDIAKNKFACKEDGQVSNYIHFVYNDFDKNHRMKYVDQGSLNKYKFHYKDLIYMYNNEHDQIRKFRQDGILHHVTFTPIEPECIKELVFMKSKLEFISNDDVYRFTEEVPGNEEIKIFPIDDDMLDVLTPYSCSILVTGIENNEQVKDYYNHALAVDLIQNDGNGNKKTIEKIKFTKDFDGFGIYNCSVRKFVSEDVNLENIKGISFLTVPVGESLLNQQEKWRNRYSIFVTCPNNFPEFASLKSMKVNIPRHRSYNSEKNKEMFIEEDTLTIFKHDELIKKNFPLKNILYQCVYETVLKTNFTVNKNGTILQIEVYDGLKKSDQSSERTTIAISIGVLMFGFVFCIVCILVILKIKKDREGRRRRRRGSNSSDSSSISSSLSGESESSASKDLAPSPKQNVKSKQLFVPNISNVIKKNANVVKSADIKIKRRQY
uniref:6-cysteine protein n=1 Tax=Parastrongyloides trichosuri TaxID=131310 RepID=A0A0N5A158_PARTI